MNTLKLKFKLNNTKEKTLSIKNVKEHYAQEDIKALANYMVQNSILNYAGAKAESFVGAVVVNTQETKIKA